MPGDGTDAAVLNAVEPATGDSETVILFEDGAIVGPPPQVVGADGTDLRTLGLGVVPNRASPQTANVEGLILIGVEQGTDPGNGILEPSPEHRGVVISPDLSVGDRLTARRDRSAGPAHRART